MSKFKIGQEACFIHDNEIQFGNIFVINNKFDHTVYTVTNSAGVLLNINEDRMFKNIKKLYKYYKRKKR